MFAGYTKAYRKVVMAVRAPSLENSIWLNHAPLSKKDLEGKIILLDFFTYGCMNCLNVLADLKTLQKEFADKLLVIGIHSGKHLHEKEEDAVKEAMQFYNIDHIVINDFDMKLWDVYGIKAWPSLVLIDAKGYVISQYQGEGHLDELRKDIKALSSKTQTKNFVPKKNEHVKGLLYYPQKIHASKDYLFISHRDEVLVCSYEGTVLHKIQGLREPQGLVYVEGVLYIALREGNSIIEVSKNFSQCSVYLEGLRNPYDLECDGDVLYVALAGSHQIKAYDLKSKKEILVIGQENSESLHDGVFDEAVLAQPSGLSLLEEELWFVDSESSSLRCAYNEEVKSYIYDNEELQHPLDIVAGQYGDGCGGGRIFICDSYNNRVKVYNPQSNEVMTLVEGLNQPSGISKKACNLYICNTNSHEIIVFDLSQMQSTVLSLKENS